MKHILIPTDFSIQSLNVVHAVISGRNNDEQVKIVLFHLLDTTNDITDIMFRSQRNKHYELINENFAEACEILQNRYSSKISSIHIKFGFGTTAAYVRNFLEGEKIDVIALSHDLQLSGPSKKSVDAVRLLKDSGFALETFSLNNNPQTQAGINTINMLPGNELKLPKKDKEYVAQN